MCKRAPIVICYCSKFSELSRDLRRSRMISLPFRWYLMEDSIKHVRCARCIRQDFGSKSNGRPQEGLMSAFPAAIWDCMTCCSALSSPFYTFSPPPMSFLCYISHNMLYFSKKTNGGSVVKVRKVWQKYVHCIERSQLQKKMCVSFLK